MRRTRFSISRVLHNLTFSEVTCNSLQLRVAGLRNRYFLKHFLLRVTATTTVSGRWTVDGGLSGNSLFLQQVTMLLELPMNESIRWQPRLQREDVTLGHKQDADTPSFEIREETKEPSEMTEEQERALGIKLDYDGSHNGLRSPQYYEDKSQCLSVAETAWPGVVGYLKADRLKRGYIEPKELTTQIEAVR
jgi:hypothetical protein